MPLNATYFTGYDLCKQNLDPVRIDEIRFDCFLYISNHNMIHCHYATFYNKGVAFVQYSEKYIAFSDFMNALFQYSADDEISVELSEWDSQQGSGYYEQRYRERVWQYISDAESFKERIKDLAYEQVESWKDQIGIIKGHSSYVEDWYNYFNSVFNIEPEPEAKDGQSELEKSWSE